ncbi:MAG: hypothetical protein K5890_04620 [Bacteroidales bacterium]|nr:hypothetical protein [Bacteroidales bacterium]
MIFICFLCFTAQAQVVIGVSRTGQVGTADQNLEFVDQFGRIVAYPSLGPTGELLDAMRPAVATNLNVSDVTTVSATTGGKVIAEGASPVTECGVCYSTSTNPTTQDDHVSATRDANGNFTVNLTGLQPNTTYHVRAYATNAIGTSYGTDFTFTTRGDAIITITGKTESKVYNGSAQSLSGYTVSIPNGVNIAETEVVYSGSAAATGTNVGEYTLTLSTGDFSCTNTNYDVTFQVANGTLTITPATATVTADTKSKTYGDADPTLTATVTGLQGNDAASSITYSVTRATGENVGTYAITPAGAAEQGNYNVTYVPANLTITKATATVTAEAKTKVYGEDDPAFTAEVSGLKNGDAASVISYTLNRAAGEDVGTYAITPAGDAIQGNYDVTYVPANLTITKATATVTAEAKTKVYGEDDPAFTAEVSGLKNGDAASVISYTLSRATGEDVDTYAITPAGAAEQGNYNVTYVPANLTITKATATVTAVAKTKVYGENDPDFTAVVSGLKNGDAASVISYTLSRATGEDVDTYAITPTGAAEQGNYNVNYVPANLTITTATATVTADNKTKTFGATDPSLTATVTGLKNGDAPSVIAFSISREEGESVGTYAIKPTGAAQQGNYDVAYVNGMFTITEPACPTLGTTTYSPNPVTASASVTSITLTTPLNNVTSVVTVSDPVYIIEGTSDPLDAHYDENSNSFTATITNLTAYRGKLIRVTPKATVSGCANPGTLLGDAVEICVQPVLPSFGTINNTNATGKTNFFYRQGSYVYAEISNYNADMIVEKGFYISSVESEVINHSCTPVAGNYGTLDISSYSSGDFISQYYQPIYNPEPKSTTTALSAFVDISHCNEVTYYRPYMVVRMCGNRDTTIYGTKKELTMWKPENMTVTANPATFTSGNTVTLTANAEMTVGAYADYSSYLPILCWMSFNDVNSNGKASMDTWVNILNGCNYLNAMMGASGSNMNWSYSWDNNATGKTRTINSPGTYTAYGNLEFNGVTCTVSKSITISTAQ